MTSLRELWSPIAAASCRLSLRKNANHHLAKIVSVDPRRLDSALHTARQKLLSEIKPEGYWTGELSSSALSTATAIMALHLVQEKTIENHDSLIQGGLQWLSDNANDDGGWGDTVKSISNISTTTLC